MVHLTKKAEVNFMTQSLDMNTAVLWGMHATDATDAMQRMNFAKNTT